MPRGTGRTRESRPGEVRKGRKGKETCRVDRETGEEEGMRGGKSTARIWPDAGRTGSSRRGRMAGKRLVLLGRPRMPSPDRDATRPLTRRRFCALFLPACPYMAFPSPTPFNIVPGSGSLAQTRRALNHPPSVRRRPAPAAPCPARPTPPAPSPAQASAPPCHCQQQPPVATTSTRSCDHAPASQKGRR